MVRASSSWGRPKAGRRPTLRANRSRPMTEEDAQLHGDKAEEDAAGHVDEALEVFTLFQDAGRLVLEGREGRVGAGEADGDEELQVLRAQSPEAFHLPAHHRHEPAQKQAAGNVDEERGPGKVG